LKKHWLFQAFPPESFEYCIPYWQVFWLTQVLVAFPSGNGRTVAEVTKTILRLQLRVQLRNFRVWKTEPRITGFPIKHKLCYQYSSEDTWKI